MLTMKTLKLLALALAAAFSCAALPLVAADDSLKDDLAKLQGKWKATVTTDDGTSNWTLEIKGDKTKVLIESKDGDVLFKGESDFKLERHGKFKAYTYFNMKILSGGDEGETRLTDGKTKSSLYKLTDDEFITTGGFREDDDDKPRLIKWGKAGK